MTEELATHAFARPLSSFESYFAVTSATIWSTDHVVGCLDRDALQMAWDLLRKAHPVLTARLVSNGDDESLPGLRGLAIAVPAAPDTSPIGPIDDEVLTLGAGGPVSMLRVSGEGATRVALALHHAIADGRLVQHWRRELWSFYTGIVEGRTPSVRPHPVPQSPEELLGERGIVKIDLPPSRLEQAAPTNVPSGQTVNPIHWQQGGCGGHCGVARLCQTSTADCAQPCCGSGCGRHPAIPAGRPRARS